VPEAHQGACPSGSRHQYPDSQGHYRHFKKGCLVIRKKWFLNGCFNGQNADPMNQIEDL
jgi:hypothetical protein